MIVSVETLNTLLQENVNTVGQIISHYSRAQSPDLRRWTSKMVPEIGADEEEEEEEEGEGEGEGEEEEEEEEGQGGAEVGLVPSSSL